MAKDASLDAQVLQRAAERGLGVAIRRGQADGTILARRENAGPQASYERNGKTVNIDLQREPSKVSPETYFSNGQQKTEIYALADTGSEADFEEALSEARAEGNVSRAGSRTISLGPTGWSEAAALEHLRGVTKMVRIRIGRTPRGGARSAPPRARGHIRDGTLPEGSDFRSDPGNGRVSNATLALGVKLCLRYVGAMDQVSLLWLMYGSAWLLVFIILLLILWAVIRAAVLSALRKHRREVWEEEHGRS